MVRLSIYHDKDLHEQFFMVRGDERYARSTKTVISCGTKDENKYSFDLDVTVNVLRDVGTGNIVIYDNDDAVYVIDDWNSESNGRTITLEELGYGVDHNVQAKYIGNGKCSPSLSNILSFNVPDSHRPESIITFDNTVQYNPNATITKTITLTNADDNPLYNDGQEIEIFYDGESLGTETTDEGVISVQIPVGSAGLHTITAVFDGSENLLNVTATQTVSVGYKIETISYPSLQLAGGDYEFKAKLTNFLGTPVANAEVDVQGYIPSQYERTVGYANTDSDGIATITANTLQGKIRFYHVYSGIYAYSESYDTKYFTPTALTASASTRLYKNNEGFVQFSIGSDLANVPITVYKDSVDSGISETLYTNANGRVTKQIMGTGEGKQYWLGKIGNIESTLVELEDFASYYGKDAKIGFTFTTDLPIQEYNNYFQFYATQLGTYYFTVQNQNQDKDYIFKIYDVVSQAPNGTLRDVYFVKGDGERITIPTPNYRRITVRRDAGVVRVYMENSLGDDSLIGTATEQDNAPIKIMMLQKTNFTKMTLIEKSTYEEL